MTDKFLGQIIVGVISGILVQQILIELRAKQDASFSTFG